MLVACRECGANVSSEAPYCPRCGVPGPGSTGYTWVVILTNAGLNKINTIKAVREVTGLGLREAMELVDRVPQVVVSGAEEAWAAVVKAKLQACGAAVEVRQAQP